VGELFAHLHNVRLMWLSGRTDLLKIEKDREAGCGQKICCGSRWSNRVARLAAIELQLEAMAE
jgi:hypothetical protein